MALVPFSVSGAAASQELEERLMQVGPYSLLLRQRPGASGNTDHLRDTRPQQQATCDQQAPAAATGSDHQQQQQQPDLSRVGLVLWQSGYVLSDFLLLRLQAAGRGMNSNGQCSSNGSPISWHGVRVLELGCGGGTVGMFLALAGAEVVLTDQEHILPLTRDNLALNFPTSTPPAAAITDGPSSKGHRSSSTQQPVSGGPGSYGLQQHQQQQQSAQAPPSLLESPAPSAATVADGSCSAAQQPLSADAAFAAAFLGQPVDGGAAVQTHQQQQLMSHKHQASSVFASGPLVAQYSWGEPLQLLHDRVAAAAAGRLHGVTSNGTHGRTVVTQPSSHSVAGAAAAGKTAGQPEDLNAACASQQQPSVAASTSEDSSQALGALPAVGNNSSPTQQLDDVAAHGYDVVVGADLLYDAAHHAALLCSLQQVAAASPHVQVYLCWRHRALGEAAFLQAAAAAGWVLQEVPTCMLHPEFQSGEYKLVRLVWLA